MSVISYMGTKAALSAQIADSFRGLPHGPLLDLFAGMASIGRAVAPIRNVWLNDVQRFSRVTSEAQFLNCSGSSARLSTVRHALAACKAHYGALIAEMATYLKEEDEALKFRDWKQISLTEQIIKDYCSSSEMISKLKDAKESAGYMLFTGLYSCTYFGLRQCIYLDSIRKGIDDAAPAYRAESAGLRQWMLASLGGAASRCSNSTGHFAQHLTISHANINRVVSQRRRDIKAEWVFQLRRDHQVGNYEWRRSNRIFCSDACDLLDYLKKAALRPAVIYADPPYTADQYSRYYHILETLIYYDYPILSSKGLYRPNRFISNWSLKTKVLDSFIALVDRASKLKSALVISYPANGLLKNSEEILPQIMRERFRSVVRQTPVAHHHSTMGASKGAQRTTVTEQIFVAS